LNKSQIAQDKLLKSCILLYGNVMQDLTNRVMELKKEEKEIIYTFKIEKIAAKQFRTEITKMENILKSYKIAIKDEMIKKFKIETDWNFLDEMEMTIINYMIIKSKSKAKDTKERFVREIRLLEVPIHISIFQYYYLVYRNIRFKYYLCSVFYFRNCFYFRIKSVLKRS